LQLAVELLGRPTVAARRFGMRQLVWRISAVPTDGSGDRRSCKCNWLGFSGRAWLRECVAAGLGGLSIAGRSEGLHFNRGDR
jgi:hypothetical protein